MSTFYRTCVAFVLLASVLHAQDAPAWKPLFNGKDLAGWTTNVTNTWVVADGVLTWKESAVDLWTVEQFGDFVLDLEFKCSPGCNSGVFIRTADPKDNVQTGLEIQLWDSFGVSKLEKHHCAALYDAQAPSANAERKPGEWNRLTITAQGSRIQVTLNDQLVNDFDLDRWTEAGKNPDGTSNKFKRPLKDFPRRGHVGLQDHHKAVWFRNVRIREL
jgi:hypothetical protein